MCSRLLLNQWLLQCHMYLITGRDIYSVNLFQVPYCSVAMLEEVIEDEDSSLMQMGGRSTSPTLSRAGRHSPTLSRLGGRSSPGGISSMSLMSRSTIRTPAPPPKVWRIVQPPFPPMTHTSVSTFDWKMLLDKE